MDPWSGFLGGLVLAVALAIVVVTAMRRPLRELLAELCGNERRARFWAVFAALTLVLCAIDGVLLAMPSAGAETWSGNPGMRTLFVGLRAGVFGLLFAFAGLGFVLLISVKCHSDERLRAR